MATFFHSFHSLTGGDWARAVFTHRRWVQEQEHFGKYLRGEVSTPELPEPPPRFECPGQLTFNFG